MPNWRSHPRILDANLNRAREAARVAEDYARFVLDSGPLAAALKNVRHQLRDIAAALDLPPGRLLSSRDTPGDVGTRLVFPLAWRRTSSQDVAAAAMKRLQEALRVIEEYAKVESRAAARIAETLRYKSYALEVQLLGPRGRVRLDAARLYVIVTSSLCNGRNVCEVAAAAIRGGAGVIQLREKDADDRALLRCARRLRRTTSDLGALFIVNDRPDIAAASGADGVHLGQTDLPCTDARRLLGPGMLIGVSAHSMAEAQRAARDGADYIGVGTVFATETRSAERLAGLPFVRRVARWATMPAYAIGGITPENVRPVVAAGASRVAVCRAVIGANDVERAARRFARQLLRSAPGARPHV